MSTVAQKRRGSGTNNTCLPAAIEAERNNEALNVCEYSYYKTKQVEDNHCTIFSKQVNSFYFLSVVYLVQN